MPARIFSTAEFGAQFKAERQARKRTQDWVAKTAGVPRKTIASLEAGGNIELRTALAALAALDKAIRITSLRPEAGEPLELEDEH